MKRLYNEEAGHNRLPQGLFSCYQQLSEKDILDLQDLFLTNGVHRVTSYDLFTGRTLIDVFLQAMAPHYHDKACLSLHSGTLDSTVFDLYLLLQLFVQNPQEDPTEYLEEFFTEQLYVDFIWIEETADLRAQSWYSVLLESIALLKLDHHIPIIIFSYETEVG